MIEPKKSIFRHGDAEVVLEYNIHYHDHLRRIREAVWECVIDDLKSGFIIEEEEGIFCHTDSSHIQDISQDAFYALVELGYDRERIDWEIEKWGDDMIEDASQSIAHQKVYGKGRYGNILSIEDNIRMRNTKHPNCR